MSKRMTVEEWHVKNGGSNARNRDLQLALWDWQNDRVELMQQNADLLAALKVTQDSARMAALGVDERMTLSPGRAVKYFNRMFPEVAKAIADAEEEHDDLLSTAYEELPEGDK